MKKALYIFLTLLLINFNCEAQEHCAFGRMQSGWKSTEWGSLNKDDVKDDNSIFIIPVVFHIIHNGGAENIPDKNIYDQMAVLNEDFGRYGGGTNNFSFSSDTRIRFCLAAKDPDGNPTSGIEHIQSSLTELRTEDEIALKNLSRWDPGRYLNIWIVRSIDGNNQTDGYAYLAEYIANDKQEGDLLDGIVMNYRFIGRNEPQNFPANNLGHSLTHETGHYFNLLHTWGGDAQGEGGCNDDDGVDDTPDCDGKFFSHYLPQYDSCADPRQCGHLRLIQDYMDYSDDHCMNTFTNGQKARMRQAILNYRQGLIVYGNSTATGCQEVFRKYNPANDKIIFAPTINGSGIRMYPYLSAKTDGIFMLYNAAGQMIYRIKITEVQNDEIDINGINLRNGLYIAMMVTKNGQYSQKIIFSTF